MRVRTLNVLARRRRLKRVRAQRSVPVFPLHRDGGTRNLEDLLEAGEVAGALVLKGDWSPSEAALAHRIYQAGFEHGRAAAASVLEQAPPERAPEEAPGAPDGETMWRGTAEILTAHLASTAEALAVAERERDDAHAALRRTAEALDDAIASAINTEPMGGWTQEDYDEWHAAREHAEGVLAAAPGTGAPVPAPQNDGALAEPDPGRKIGTADEEVPQDARTGAAVTAPSSGSASVPAPLGVGGDEQERAHGPKNGPSAPDGETSGVVWDIPDGLGGHTTEGNCWVGDCQWSVEGERADVERLLGEHLTTHPHTPGTCVIVAPFDAVAEAPEPRLWDAFVAGFMASGEGYNGEYPFGDRGLHPSQADYVREAFDKWATSAPGTGAPSPGVGGDEEAEQSARKSAGAADADADRHADCRGQWCCGCDAHPDGKPWGWNYAAWELHRMRCHPAPEGSISGALSGGGSSSGEAGEAR